MRIFIDTEFIERGREHPVTLISLGAIKENGTGFYEISSEFDPETANPWVVEHVIEKLPPKKPRLTVAEIAGKFLEWVGTEKPEFWAYYADYDWVVLCQMYGAMINLPTGWPMFCRDIKQWCVDLGNPDLPKQEKGEHDAMEDARWNKAAWEYLRDIYENKQLRDHRALQIACEQLKQNSPERYKHLTCDGIRDELLGRALL
jgi:hypothetical protein